MQRRNYIKAIGGIAGAATITGAFALSGSTGARATATQNLGDATVTSDDGSVQYVAIYGDSTVNWTGFDTEATHFQEVIDARVVDSTSWVQLYDTGQVSLDNDDWGGANEDLSGPGTSGYISAGIGLDADGNHDTTIDWHIVGDDPDNYGLPANSIDPSAIEVDQDGGTGNFTIEVRSQFTWFDTNGDSIFTKEFTSDVGVTVNNVEAGASSENGDGEDGAVAE